MIVAAKTAGERQQPARRSFIPTYLSCATRDCMGASSLHEMFFMLSFVGASAAADCAGVNRLYCAPSPAVLSTVRVANYQHPAKHLRQTLTCRIPYASGPRKNPRNCCEFPLKKTSRATSASAGSPPTGIARTWCGLGGIKHHHTVTNGCQSATLCRHYLLQPSRNMTRWS